jgi:hypothetical protein
MKRSIVPALLVLALAGIGARTAVAAGVSPYFESSANQKPRGNAGLSVSGDRMKLNADLALRAPNKATEVVPRVSSAFSLGNRLDLETRVDLSDWNSRTAAAGAKVDTRLHFQSSAPFLDELEGRVWRSPDGQSGRILKFGFYQKLSAANAPGAVTIRSKAIVESTVGRLPLPALPASGGESGLAARPENRRFGVETEVGGLMSRLASGRGALKIKLDKVAGSRPETAGSVGYDQQWKLGLGAQLGFNVNMLRATYSTAGSFVPSVGISWHWSP